VPPVNHEKLDQLLSDFLEKKNEESRKGFSNEVIIGTLQKISDNMQEHIIADEKRFLEIKGIQDAQHHRLTNLEKVAAEAEEEREVTGKHNLEELKKKASWWTDKIQTSVYNGIMLLVALGAYEFIRNVVHK
jgi:hypothetical protein